MQKCNGSIAKYNDSVNAVDDDCCSFAFCIDVAKYFCTICDFRICGHCFTSPAAFKGHKQVGKARASTKSSRSKGKEREW